VDWQGINPLARIGDWLDHIDPGVHRRIKGLRVVTAFGIAAMLGTMSDIDRGLPVGVSLSMLAGNIALWASILEGQATRVKSSRDLVLLSAAAVIGALTFIVLAPPLGRLGPVWPELILAAGAFCTGYLRRFGITGAGVGSQIFIGQLLAYQISLRLSDIPLVVVAGLIAAGASVVPRVLSGPAEHPAPRIPLPTTASKLRPELAMGLQAAAAALLVVALNATFGLLESAWAITASTFVIGGTSSGTIQRVKRRIIGTAIGVPIGLALLPLAAQLPLLAWSAAALAMVIYAMALPERYDIACGAYAVTLILTLAIAGEHSLTMLTARAWETVLGGITGVSAAMLIFPLRFPAADSPGRTTLPRP
jgi:hypothetical protein